MRRFGLPRAFVFGVLLVAVQSTTIFSAEFGDLKVGQKAPDFSLRDLSDKIVNLSDLKGQIVVIQFGSSTTLPFLEQIKPMNKLIDDYKGKRIAFLTIYTAEQQFNWQAPDYFAKSQRADGVRFQFGAQTGRRMASRILVDDMDQTIYKVYGSVPAGVFIVDEGGNLAFKAKMVDASEVEQALKKIAPNEVATK